MTGSHDMALVWLSVIIAMTASYTALDVAGRMRAATGRLRTIWLVAAASVMGGGIWSMHFVAMLAYHMPGMAFGYDPVLTAASLILAFVATLISFSVMSHTSRSIGVLLGAGTFMGLAVVSMHYMGMSAMRMPAIINYDSLWVTASIAIAIAASTAALWISFRSNRTEERVGAAVVMGFAISGMHYAAMQGVSFTMKHDHAGTNEFNLDQNALGIGITIASFAILLCALAAAAFDRRKAEVAAKEAKALRISQERFQALYRGTPLPLHSLSRDGLIEQVSDAWLHLTGYARSQVIGKPLADFMTEDSARHVLSHAAPELARHGSINEVECRFVTSSGSIIDVLMSATIYRDDEGRFVSILGGLNDVTERRRTEEALRQSQKIEAIGHLTGGVAHDFNNLLAVVVGNLDLARRRIKEDPKLARLIDNAMEGANRGAALTQRLLAFARRQDLKPTAVNVVSLINGMSDMLQRSLGPMIQVETSFRSEIAPACVDAHQLEMAILNLAVNARDAMPEGGVLRISAQEEEIIQGQHELPAGRYVRIEVADDGIGMDQATLARASEPFFTTKDVGHGTGLGLSMVQGLAAQSGGKLDIRSVIGQGTTITIWLPKDEQGRVEQSAASKKNEAPVAAMKILVVDDDPLVLDNTAAMLEDLGHQVMTATSGQEALVLAEAGLDLLVTDQLMPGMTGTQLAQEMSIRHPNLPIMLVSGYSDLAELSKIGLTLLPKPFDQDALDRALRTAQPCRKCAA